MFNRTDTGRVGRAAGVMLCVAVLGGTAGVAARQAGAAGPTGQTPGAPPPPAQGIDDPANAAADFSPKPPVVALSPADGALQFWLPPGYRLEPILTEPDIEAPVAMAFDGNGRMYVVEIPSYMKDADATGQMDPVNRISRHEDLDGDGRYERHTVFVDGLVFPRFVLPFGADAILTMESSADDVWKFTDTNADGVADRKELFVTRFGRAGNVQLQQAGLFLAMDNWMYSTFNAFRVRWTPAGVIREPTGPNGGSWGVTQDNNGKVWFQSGFTGMPGYFQFPVHYGNFAVDDQFEPDLSIMWGAPVLTADVHDGMPFIRMPDGSLSRGTASAGNDVFRGDRLPADMVGDYLYGEVVGRLVRRLRPVVTEGLTQLRNVYPRSEFIRSLDPLFRPTDVATAPDGTLYIADMYRGIMEESEWTKPGTYLRRKIAQYQLEKVVGYGRIWRLTHDGIPRDTTRPNMLNEAPAQLVPHLAHPNGWWRDTAQQLLVLRQDTSVTPALRTMLRTSGSAFGRIHALWTLEGLAALDTDDVRAAMRDADPRLRIQAIRASESLFKAGDASLADDYRRMTRDPDTDVVIQAMLTLHVLKVADVATVVRAAMDGSSARGVREVGGRILNPPAPAGRGRGGSVLSSEQQQSLERGGTIYAELCALCHGVDGRGTPKPGAPLGTTMAPPIAGSTGVQSHSDYVVKVLLHGLTGPVAGRAYSEPMVRLGANPDVWIADVASYVRSSFGNNASFVTPADVARVRARTGSRDTAWTVDEIERTLPLPLIPDSSWKATASHNAAAAAGAFSLAAWNSGVAQQAGMWFTVELPRVSEIVEIHFDSPVAAGRGAAPAPPASGFPRGYRVETSTDGAAWRIAAEGQGTTGGTVIVFPPVQARFVRITQTAAVDGAPVWSIQRLRVFQGRGRTE
jgi:mono/diheme cytochrome c family protein/glucose/arabinose dehydrogenase